MVSCEVGGAVAKVSVHLIPARAVVEARVRFTLVDVRLASDQRRRGEEDEEEQEEEIRERLSVIPARE